MKYISFQERWNDVHCYMCSKELYSPGGGNCVDNDAQHAPPGSNFSARPFSHPYRFTWLRNGKKAHAPANASVGAR